MMRRLTGPGLAAGLLLTTLSVAGAQDTPASASAKAQDRSKPADAAQPGVPGAAVKWLASGVALYPDPVLEKILEAAQRPAAVRQAAEALKAPGGFDPSKTRLPESVAALAQQYPRTIQTLAEKPGLTARLGREFRKDPRAVWAAIEQARKDIEARKAQGAAPGPNDPPADPKATPEENGSAATALDLATPEAQDDLCNDENAPAPAQDSDDDLQPAPLAGAGQPAPAGNTTVVPGGGGGTTVVAGGAPYSSGYVADGVGGYVRRGWYGHDAFFGGYGYGAGYGGYGYHHSNRDGRRVDPNNHGIGPNHNRLYDHADANRVNAADRALHRNAASLHHGADEHNDAHHHGEHHHSSDHHGEHHHASHHHSGGGKRK